MFAVADVLNVLDHICAQPMIPHDGQHLSVHQVMGSEAVGVATVPPREVFTNVESFTGRLLVTDLFSALSFVTFAYLGHKKWVTLDEQHR